MSRIINALIPVISGIYLLLILKGVIKLPLEKQVKFDEYMRNKRKWVIPLCYALILLPVIALVIEMLNTKTIYIEKPLH